MDCRVKSGNDEQATEMNTAFLIQLLVNGLVVGTLEVWWGLSLLGHPVGFGEALAIEALTLAARQVAFFIPAGLGVQEAVIVLLGTSFGIDPQTSLALALVKRAREVLFGVPALLSWQWVEWRQMRRRVAG